MVSSQEIIERSFYMSLLHTALKNGLTLDPDNYLPINPTSQAKYLKDKEALDKYVYIFGVGNNQSRGKKEVPRITLDLQGYYPGTIGVEKYHIDVEDSLRPVLVESEFTTKSIVLDVHLVANNQNDMRMLHSIMYKALPASGYIKPFTGNKEEYLNTGLNPTGNIFIEVTNHYDHTDNSQGLLEKVYSYTVEDGLVIDNIDEGIVLSPIIDISVILDHITGSSHTISVQ